jgi:predicted Zn-dependent protease
MAQARRDQITALLAQDPKDAFLRYALAMEFAAEGDAARAVTELRGLVADSPDYVAGYQQCGQLLMQLGNNAEAAAVLRQGLAAARQAGESHAAEEIQGLLAMAGE